VSDPGEFKSLSALGIVEIDLGSNHQQAASSDGSVITFGGSTFTTANGETGLVADIGFGNFDGTGQGANGSNPSNPAPNTGDNSSVVIDPSALAKVDITDVISDYQSGKSGELSQLLEAQTGKEETATIAASHGTTASEVPADANGGADNAVPPTATSQLGIVTALYSDASHHDHAVAVTG
jgi:hypothetical protein